jgi:hypothetical protein
VTQTDENSLEKSKISKNLRFEPTQNMTKMAPKLANLNRDIDQPSEES